MTTSPVRRTAARLLTERALLALKPGQKRADGALPPGFGRLIVRAQGRADAVIRQFFFRYRDADGKDRTLLLGVYGSSASAIDLAEARRKAHALREQMQAGLDCCSILKCGAQRLALKTAARSRNRRRRARWSI